MPQNLASAFLAWPYVVQGVAVALLVALVSTLSYLVLLTVWPWTWAYPQTGNSSSDYPIILSLQLAFGQVYLGLVAIALAAGLGYFAIREFHEGHARPRLGLRFLESETEQLDPTGARSFPFTFTVALLNSGPAIAVWYMVELEATFLCQFFGPESSPEEIAECVQCTPPGTQFDVRWKDQGQSAVLTFRSNGTVAAYPRFDLPIWRFTIQDGWIPAGLYRCPYVIVQDRGGSSAGSLELSMP